MDASAIETAKQYLRLKYLVTPATSTTGPVYTTPALRALADLVAEGAFEQVTITGQTFEGGSHQGQVVFPRMDYLRAVLELIAEADPAGTPQAPSRTSFADFRRTYAQV